MAENQLREEEKERGRGQRKRRGKAPWKNSRERRKLPPPFLFLMWRGSAARAGTLIQFRSPCDVARIESTPSERAARRDTPPKESGISSIDDASVPVTASAAPRWMQVVTEIAHRTVSRPICFSPERGFCSHAGVLHPAIRCNHERIVLVRDGEERFNCLLSLEL